MPAFSSLSIPELVTIGGIAAPRKDGKTAAPDCPVTATFGAAGSVLTSDTGGFGHDRIRGPMRVLITGACGFVGRNLMMLVKLANNSRILEGAPCTLAA